MKQLQRVLLIFLIGTSMLSSASPASSFFAAHQQTILFTAGSFVAPVAVANIVLLIAKKASIRSALYSLLLGVPCGATLLARSALARWTTLPDDQLLYYGAWCGVAFVAIVSAIVSHFTMRKDNVTPVETMTYNAEALAKMRMDSNRPQSNPAANMTIDLLAAGFVAWFLTKCGTGTLRFANWIAEIKR
jgi:hypothetical protein